MQSEGHLCYWLEKWVQERSKSTNRWCTPGVICVIDLKSGSKRDQNWPIGDAVRGPKSPIVALRVLVPRITSACPAKSSRLIVDKSWYLSRRICFTDLHCLSAPLLIFIKNVWFDMESPGFLRNHLLQSWDNKVSLKAGWQLGMVQKSNVG